MPDALQLLDTTRPFTRAAALRAGYSQDEVRHRLRRGLWVRLRHGVYMDAEAHRSLRTPAERHRALVLAHLLKLGPGGVASHRSAALLHGLPLLELPGPVEITLPEGTQRSGPALRVYQSPLPEGSLLVADPPLTSVARTVLDLGRALPFRDALVAADAALNTGAVGKEELRAYLEVVRTWPGSPGAARVVRFADGRAESPGETLSRIDLSSIGIPDLELQAVVEGASGRAWRVDFLSRALRTVFEFEGKVKYLDGTLEEGRRALLREKEREDDLRLAGYGFVRISWAELGRPALLRRKLEVAVSGLRAS
ncbi:hypothetical protein EV189_2545 [Motilibacter rhizosphaerae]|uniref:Uncharacterized protein n=1 Tax=Motilibacter rhizosphaerae TaxID=598652 RepID=A0A4Q7NPL6_9ACTN|nr:type IV toxin-antitoxin system AbiEi family antitoxin domain-containing protein [Motilibacter rhizosphaerae]RZS87123.1 hypothetical protein EV189_2545 [Motilibacter rhizosphaerae]